MGSLFDDAASEQMLERVRALAPDTPALWGKMDVAQMLVHCRRAMQVATGELELRRSILGMLMGGLIKKAVLGPMPFKPNMPTDRSFLVREPRDFTQEQSEMVATIQSFTRGGPGGLTRNPHPFFGAMSAEDWDALMFKHLDHHLRQFGM